MVKIYCEFCGKEAAHNIHFPKKLIEWTHEHEGDVIRCEDHERTPLAHPSCGTFDPFTGERKPESEEDD